MLGVSAGHPVVGALLGLPVLDVSMKPLVAGVVVESLVLDTTPGHPVVGVVLQSLFYLKKFIKCFNYWRRKKGEGGSGQL